MKTRSPQSGLDTKLLNVCICVPSNGMWMSDFGRCLVTAAMEFQNWQPPKEMGYTGRITQTLTADSSMLVRNRHDLVKASMKAGATHILFLDSDMKFPRDLIARMLLRNEVILAANATQRRLPIKPIAHDFDGQLINSAERSGVEEVRQVGCAVMMIKREFFENVRPPYFLMDWTPDAESYSGEDIYFCAVAQEAGYKVMIDHDLSRDIEHMGFYSFGYKDIDSFGQVSAADKLSKLAFYGGEE